MTLATTVHGTGRPVVVLPGFGLDAAFAAAAFEPAFAEAGAEEAGRRQRIYVHLPGTGDSPAGTPSSDAVLEAVREATAGLETFDLAGHSFGGYLAAGFARRWPGRLTGLMLVCCGERIRPGDRNLDGVPASAPEPGWLDGVPPGLREDFEVGVGHQTRAVADRIGQAFTLLRPMNEAYLDALRPAGYRLSDEPVPGDGRESFAGPVLVLAGRRDRISGYRDAVTALERYPGGDCTVLAEAGHYLPLEQPERFAALTRDWFRSTQRA